MKVAYKWLVSGNTYAYIAQPSSNNYYIGNSFSEDEDIQVANRAKIMSEETYKNNFNAMASELDSNYGVKLLDYAIYYNLSVDDCASLIGPVGPTGPMGERGAIGPLGPTGPGGGSGSSPIDISKNDTITYFCGIVNSGDTLLNEVNALTSITASNTGGISSENGFFQTSDIRLKEIIDNATFDIEKIINLSLVYFTYKGDENKKRHLGLIAQEIKDICPEIVKENEKGYLEIEYDKISLLLLFVVKKLYNMVLKK